jgi:hypothetical protein
MYGNALVFKRAQRARSASFRAERSLRAPITKGMFAVAGPITLIRSLGPRVAIGEFFQLVHLEKTKSDK